MVAPAPAIMGLMKPDLYIKAVLTVTAVALVAIACNQYIEPKTTAQAQGASFAGVQVNGNLLSNLTAFDSRTGEVWQYELKETGGGWALKLAGSGKVTKFGSPTIPVSVAK
jgi:hypothetical protein